MANNNEDESWIEIKCKYQVYDEEWAEILFLISNLLQEHDNGKFSNVDAYLCKDKI